MQVQPRGAFAGIAVKQVQRQRANVTPAGKQAEHFIDPARADGQFTQGGGSAERLRTAD
jgi:hypothetical protein